LSVRRTSHRSKPKSDRAACPPPRPSDCTSHARWCPRWQGGGLVLDDVKSRVLRRTGQHHLPAGHRVLPTEEPHLVPAAPPPDAGDILRSLLPACHRGSVGSGIGQPAGHRLIEDRQERLFTLVRMVARGGIEPPTFRFSGLGMRVHQALRASVTCIDALIRTPVNPDERMRMRPKMSPPGPRCLADAFARGGVGDAASPDLSAPLRLPRHP